MFTPEETSYLAAQPLARLATVASNGQPTADAVGFRFDGERFWVGGLDLRGSRKGRNVAAGNRLVALIVDDLAAVEPWTPRGIKIHGTAELVRADGMFGPGDYFAITPAVSWSWGILDAALGEGGFAPHKIVWTAPAATTA
jgi:pyridoxamine 5'-phosphate oxidase family protein